MPQALRGVFNVLVQYLKMGVGCGGGANAALCGPAVRLHLDWTRHKYIFIEFRDCRRIRLEPTPSPLTTDYAKFWNLTLAQASKAQNLFGARLISHITTFGRGCNGKFYLIS